MRQWTPEQIAAIAGARLVGAPARSDGPERVVIDSREAGPDALFVGLAGQNVDGGRFAGAALASGAWGVMAAPAYVEAAATGTTGVLLSSEDPLTALQRLATAWRRSLGAKVIGVTGSTGKTSTKDLLLAVLAPHRRTVASRANFNTEIGLPLEILGAPAQTEVLVLEMAMRGTGQIDELAAIAEPDVGVIVSVGPVHLELLGTIEAIAAAKAELIAGLAPGATAVVPFGEPLLAPHLRGDVVTVTFGPGGDVSLVRSDPEEVEIDLAGEPITLAVPFRQAHLRRNLLAAVAAARAVGVRPEGRVEVALSAGRGEQVVLRGGITLIDDCYNANPMSMRAALDELAAIAGRSAGDVGEGGDGGDGALRRHRRVAVLGDMLELGPSAPRFHTEIGEYARRAGVDVLVTVGPLARSMCDAFAGEVHCTADAAEAAELVPQLLSERDVMLVKGSRGVGLEFVCRAVGAHAESVTTLPRPPEAPSRGLDR